MALVVPLPFYNRIAGRDGRIAVRSAFAQAALVVSDLFYASGFISVFQEKDPGQKSLGEDPKIS